MEDEESRVTLGEIIRRQRELAELSMRQLASMVGISNPYLSQIERGLRAPSGRVLHAIATSLRTTADALVAQASPATPGPPEVLRAIAADPNLTARQRQALGEVYSAMAQVTIARRGRERGPANDGRPGT
ncbi:helix-turn-helix domain-containing protein [Actinoplanes sp. L3-i22]|uniref:helix-turn-helix domain-containing protein n=1 Tax=Actinoplanes sp. L3-i22 TaxID=2836373 RepID=UPI001C84C853|nr:helix-turn-helix transcriptional regulator [Actinoplanes sp. L3-i22]